MYKKNNDFFSIKFTEMTTDYNKTNDITHTENALIKDDQSVKMLSNRVIKSQKLIFMICYKNEAHFPQI
jgi:hypothetical protein